MVGEIHKVKVSPADIEALKKGMLTMPTHPDVKKGLQTLKDAGFRMATKLGYAALAVVLTAVLADDIGRTK